MTSLVAIQKILRQHQLDYSHETLLRFLQTQYPQAEALDLWLALLVSLEISQGNVCLPLDKVIEKSRQLGWHPLPDLRQLQKCLKASPLIGEGDEVCPLIVEHDKLYLNRFYHNEKNIAARLRSLARTTVNKIGQQQINRYFPAGSEAAVDYQKLAAIISARHALAIISGGPGTGKTWTVSRILAILLEQNEQQIIRLAAPTGKAAARMVQSIKHSFDQLDIDARLKQKIPSQAVTLHRLLNIHRYTHRPRYGQGQPLSCDVLVLDEASMIDQQMMAMICAALPAGCKLILLGDKDQLASVEAGSIFADLCGGLMQTEFSRAQCDWLQQSFSIKVPEHPGDYALADQVVVLQKSHRFDAARGIGKLARLVNRGDAQNSITLLEVATKQPLDDSALHWRQLEGAALIAQLEQQALGDSRSMMRAASIDQAFACFHRSQLLSAVWKGPAGVDTINHIFEKTLKQAAAVPATQDYFKGQPLMMTSNLYQYDIHNGDIGIVWPDPSGDLKVWFEQAAGEYRMLSIAQCPAHKTAYAMTVHKSQGSEFSHIVLLLPDNNSAVATRELLYTGITRAAKSVEIWASEAALRAAIERKTERVSGLPLRLRKAAQ